METKKLTELKLGKDFVIHKDSEKHHVVAKLTNDINIVLDGEEDDDENPWHWEPIEGTDIENCSLLNIIEEFPGDLIIEQGACLDIDPNESYFQVKGDVIVNGHIRVDDLRLEEIGWVSVLGDIKLGPAGTTRGKLSFIEVSGEVVANFDIDDFKNKRHIAFICYDDEVCGVSVDKQNVIDYFVNEVKDEGSAFTEIYIYEVEASDNFEIMTNMCFMQRGHVIGFPVKKLKI